MAKPVAASQVGGRKAVRGGEGHLDGTLGRQIRAEPRSGLPIDSVTVRPLTAFDRQVSPGLRPNLTPAGTIEVTFATADRLSAAYLAGRDGFRHRLIVMLPAN